MNRRTHAWAIHLGLTDFDRDTGSKIGHGLAGVHFFDRMAPIPANQSGITASLFATRAMARVALPECRKGWPRARVVRVEVVLRWVAARG